MEEVTRYHIRKTFFFRGAVEMGLARFWGLRRQQILSVHNWLKSTVGSYVFDFS